jgi:hypothetical protein
VTMMKKITIAGFMVLLLGIFILPVHVQATSVTIGNPSGDGGNVIPFNNHFAFFGSLTLANRYQQVYAASYFSSPMLIDSITFYDANYDPNNPRDWGAAIEEATYIISLSTISKPVNGLEVNSPTWGNDPDAAVGQSPVVQSSDFDINLGADNTLFFSGVLGGPIGGDTYTIAGTPFSYNPAGGNLLLDIKIIDTLPNQYGSGAFASYPDTNDPSFAGFSRAQNFGSGQDGYGLVTTFSDGSSAVPLPTTMFLLGSGLIGLMGLKRKYLG